MNHVANISVRLQNPGSFIGVFFHSQTDDWVQLLIGAENRCFLSDFV